MSDLPEKLARFEQSLELLQLENLLRWPNIFSILDLYRYTIGRPQVLAWLLNPRANHGLGDAFLRELCKAVNIDVEGVNLSGVTVQRETLFPKHENTTGLIIDLLIIHRQFVIALEDKIGIPDDPSRQRDFLALAEAAFPGKTSYFVSLTLRDDDPAPEAAGTFWRRYSCERLCEAIHRIHNAFMLLEPDDDDPDRPGLNDIQKRVAIYLDDYQTYLRRQILDNDDHLVKKAGEVYRAHMEAIDFIINHRPAFREQAQQEGTLEKRDDTPFSDDIPF